MLQQKKKMLFKSLHKQMQNQQSAKNKIPQKLSNVLHYHFISYFQNSRTPKVIIKMCFSGIYTKQYKNKRHNNKK